MTATVPSLAEDAHRDTTLRLLQVRDIHVDELHQIIAKLMKRLVGKTIPFMHSTHLQYGRVLEVRGFGRTHWLHVLNLKTGVERDVELWQVLEAARELDIT